MSDTLRASSSLEWIEQFERHYDYDCSYLKEMLQHSPEGFATFEGFSPMGRFEKAIPRDVLWVAKIATMTSEDCGACTQLNIRMAKEAGVAPDVLRSAVRDGEGLPDELRDVRDFAARVAQNQEVAPDLRERIESRYSKEIMVELALAIASAKIYPTLKRTLGHAGSCALYDFEY